MNTYLKIYILRINKNKWSGGSDILMKTLSEELMKMETDKVSGIFGIKLKFVSFCVISLSI